MMAAQQLLKRHNNLFAVVGLILVFTAAGAVALQQMSARTAGWRTDFSVATVPMADFFDTGIGRDGILPIDQPMLKPAGSVGWLADQSPVIAVELAGEARAYPLAVLLRHEIVNDMLGGLPIAVTFCPLCHSPMTYDRTLMGRTLRLGVTGYLLGGGFIMWDDATESWWQQFTGMALVGEYTGQMLTVVPSQLVSYGVFRATYPNGTVLVGDAQRPELRYGRSPYIGYEDKDTPLFNGEAQDERFRATGRVLSAVINGVPVAYPFVTLSLYAPVNDIVGGVPLVAFWQPGMSSALDQPWIDEGRDVGMAALYERRLPDARVLEFVLDESGAGFRDTATGSLWNMFGQAIEGELAGLHLTRLNCGTRFWFAWSAAHPETLLYTP